MIDCTKDTSGTDGRLFDWGYPLIPADRLSTQVLVGWAPGCTNSASSPSICEDPDINGGAKASRSVIWITPIADTTVYVNFNGNNIDCADPGATSQHNFAATALTSYRLVDDPGDGITGEDDYDMTGARITTCDDTDLAVAYGQDPNRSGGNDDEALDLGTVVLPLGGGLVIDKSVDKSEVAIGGSVTYTYEVKTTRATMFNVFVTDNKCSPVVYSTGDDGDNELEKGEIWEFTCTTNIYEDTVNVAYATGTIKNTSITLESPPDQELVTVVEPAVIGNYVWLDEDGDGVQDAGETGIPNVTVTLTGNDANGNPVNLTFVTDANGGYLFKGLPPSNGSGYTITVTPPAGLNQTYDENGLGSPNATTVVVAAGDEHLSADFGYNWAPTSDVTGNTGNGSIGDRVWIDANGDGVQDPGEAGLGGVTVTLYTDPDQDGVYDNVAGTTVTDAAGNYIFDNLPAGSYVVGISAPVGYTQTGDPDDSLDHQTTSPVVLGPGDVYVNADFGYQPSGDSSTIGDTIYFDADGDGTYEPGSGEYGIPGVTVSLIDDLDGDGVFEPGEPIIATTITDENGLYSFPGLPAGDYIVLVNDTDHILGELAPSGDPDGGDDNRSAVTVDGVNDNLLQDFGYAPPGHDAGEGLIGDTIWLDDGDNTFEPGEGLEGVRVNPD